MIKAALGVGLSKRVLWQITIQPTRGELMPQRILASVGRCGLGCAPVRRRGKTARPRVVLARTAAAGLTRPTVEHRVDNQVAGASVANRRRRRSDRSRTDLPTVACRGANRSLRPGQTVVTAARAVAHRAGLRSATWSRREERRG